MGGENLIKDWEATDDACPKCAWQEKPLPSTKFHDCDGVGSLFPPSLSSPFCPSLSPICPYDACQDIAYVVSILPHVVSILPHVDRNRLHL